MMLLGRVLREKTLIQLGLFYITLVNALKTNMSISLVPTLAIGFDDVRQRVQAQSEISTAHQEKIKVRLTLFIPQLVYTNLRSYRS